MEGGECDFPIKTLKEIVLDNNEVGDLNKESIIKENWRLTCKIVSDEYKNRDDFSQYLIDPNRFRFKKIVRVMALVYLFVLKFMSKYGSRCSMGSNECTSQMGYKFPNDVPKIIKYCNDQYILTTGKYSSGGRVVCLPESMIEAAMGYFYRKATKEIKHFVNKSAYAAQSAEVNGILYYTGRILCNQGIKGAQTLRDACFDLSKATFRVPLSDAMSPIAHAVMNDTLVSSTYKTHRGRVCT